MPGPREWSPRKDYNFCETREDRALLMKQIGVGGHCLVDGKVVELLEFCEVAGIYRFAYEDGSFFYVSDEAFYKEVSTLQSRK